MSAGAGRRPWLIVITGRPGTGKTTLSRAMVRELNATYLRIDAIETALRVAAGDHAPWPGPEGYAIAHRLAESNLTLGRDVIIDAVCPIPEARTGWADTAAGADARLLMIETALADQDEHRRRVVERVPDLPGQRIPSWEEVTAGEWMPWSAERDGPRSVVDTGSAIGAVDAVRRLLADRS